MFTILLIIVLVVAFVSTPQKKIDDLHKASRDKIKDITGR
jgi:hypothetical protein